MSKALVGKTITAVQLASDKEAIRFLIKDGDPIVAKCDADCCSHTWIESVELPINGLPATVLSMDDSKYDSSDNGQLKTYGLKIVTDKGTIELEYHNESNGYYGGNLSWDEDEYFYGGVYGQNVSNEDWQPIVV